VAVGIPDGHIMSRRIDKVSSWFSRAFENQEMNRWWISFFPPEANISGSRNFRRAIRKIRGHGRELSSRDFVRSGGIDAFERQPAQAFPAEASVRPRDPSMRQTTKSARRPDKAEDGRKAKEVSFACHA